MFPRFKNDSKYADNFSPHVEKSSLKCSIKPKLAVVRFCFVLERPSYWCAFICMLCKNTKI